MTNPTPPGQVPEALIYAELPDLDDTLWLAIGQHRRAITIVETSAAAKAVDAAVHSLLRAYADATHALRAQQPAPATQQAGEVRRAELVPGVMHCAKCKFQLNRVTLCVSDGNAYAGNNKTEPCPNGCGPLWPVTWEQEAKNCWKALEEMHERLMAAATPQPSPTPQAESQPAPEYVGKGMFKGETIEKAAEHWANWCDVRCMTGLSEFLRVVAARAPADSVTAPAGGWHPFPHYLQNPDGRLLRTSADLLERHGYTGCSTPLRRMADALLNEPAAPTPPAQAADSVLGDAETALRKVLGVVQRYLPPDGPSAHDSLSEIIEIVDPWPLGPLEKP